MSEKIRDICTMVVDWIISATAVILALFGVVDKIRAMLKNREQNKEKKGE